MNATDQWTTPEGRRLIFRDAFSELDDEQRKRLRKHAESGTRILCGADRNFFWRGGAG